jgi:hypothetical protein
MVSDVAFMPSMVSAGSPGIISSRAKMTTDAINNVNNRTPRRRRMNPAIFYHIPDLEMDLGKRYQFFQ